MKMRSEIKARCAGVLQVCALTLLIGLGTPAANAAPTEEEIAAARLEYIAGNYEEALKVIVPAAEAGDAIAQNIMGDAYDDGKGVPQDKDLALEWWEKAAAQEFDKALFNLGRRYQPDDIATAITYYERSAEQGFAPALYTLARIIQYGEGSDTRDYDRAASLYAQAAAQNHGPSLNELGLMYIYATGVPEDLTIAFDLFARGAAAGNAEAIGNLGIMYTYSYSVAPDPLAAMALFELAAEMGSGTAAVNLAFDLIEEAPDAYRDPALGWAWCQVGMSRLDGEDLEIAQEDCTYLGELLDEETRAEGLELVSSLPQ